MESLQWSISLGCMDIHIAVMTVFSFRATPRDGHLRKVKQVYSYTSKIKHATIRIRVEEPNFPELPNELYNWNQSLLYLWVQRGRFLRGMIVLWNWLKIFQVEHPGLDISTIHSFGYNIQYISFIIPIIFCVFCSESSETFTLVIFWTLHIK